MKTDNYLTLCLEQAAKSPLHYRHGAVVVRGGKVIGQGFNDYRAGGYDGGALKHGRIGKGSFDGPAVANLKEKLKKKPKDKQQQRAQSGACFVPFEGTGGGHHANTPLSMHSEMMAIHSALAASSTMASTAASHEKPSFKLPRCSKPKAKLRQEALLAYVNTILHHGHNNKVEEEQEDPDQEQQEQEGPHRSLEKSLAFQEPPSGEKHHHHQKKGNEKKNQKNEYGYQYDRYGQQTQQQHSPQPPSASKITSSNVIRGYDTTNAQRAYDYNLTKAYQASGQHGKHKKDYKRSGKMRAGADEPSQPEPLLLPKGQTNGSSSSVNDRKKHPRLNGADVYVARLGWCRTTATKQSVAQPMISAPADCVSSDADTTGEPLSASTSSIASTGSGSLHDELINRDPSPNPTKADESNNSLDLSTVRASHPCYRCISYMHSVGIKRVFWTNDAGQWEGGKIRDLVHALDNSMDNVADGGQGGPMGNGVFITKHEVLMFKRMMGQGKA
ncbi:hypothetical protein LTR37_011386 [Vermiconidia calcicola]|uniref:Uncharacterized protein n=1 Tax=Vermiconidia calcicola TaxID=1690605 RepID=A0ACC3N2Y4_9PEZI|nr:hypothetical protein LTR37_011386 [Vermiconidia calcicola]